MPEHQIHWTALPRRADSSHLELDVFVSPRLGIDAVAPEYVLGEFPELATWTARVAANEFAFGVSFDGGPPVPATIVAQDPLDEDLWEHLFPSGTLVLPWSFQDHSTRTIRSFPLRWVVAYLRDVYKEVGGASGSDLPKAEDLKRLGDDLGGLRDTRVPEEQNLATEHPNPTAAAPHGKPMGCLAAILAPLCRPLRRLCRWLRKLLGLGGVTPGSGSGPTSPGKPVPGSVEFLNRPPAPRPDDPYEEIEAEIAAHGVVPPPSTTGYPVTFAFAQVMRFYDRTEAETKTVEHPDVNKVPPSPAEPRWDFHRRAGALGDYPSIMQRLGLVIRIRVPRPATSPQAIGVVPSVAGALRPAIDVTPATACTLAGERFHATPRPESDLVDGMLDLRGADDRLETVESPFDLVQLDADGAALKAINTAASLERHRQVSLEGLVFTMHEPEPLPATRTAGIAIVRSNRAWGLKRRLVEMRKQWLGHGSEVLYADEIVRGYQVWVKHEGEPWRSLCEREGVYRLVDDAGALVGHRAIDDHGYVKRSGATSKDGSSDLYVHEALVRWAGWSLVAPLPGKTVTPVKGTRVDPETGATVPTQKEKAVEKVSSAATGFRLETRFSPPPGSLPRLRFKEKYRFAMAWVDLAGNPLAQLDKGPDGLGAAARASDEVTFRRFEPVPPPSVLPLAGFTPGGSLERLVVRSDFNRSPAQWLAGVGPVPGYAEHDDRRLFAPKTSQLMAEQHGRFDAAFGPLGKTADGFALGVREKGTFLDPAIPFGIPGKAGDAIVNSHPDAVLVTPYLPDPIAAGIVLRGVPNLDLAKGVSGHHLDVVAVPGVEGPVLRIPFSGAWPDIESVRIRLVGSDPGGAPHWNAAKRLLTIHLAKGAEVEVLYSCYVDPTELDAMGAWDWIDDGDPTGELHQQAQQSVHWLIAPWRTLTLVHAVQHPLAEPKLEPGTAAKRKPSETFATVTGTATVDPDSTSRVDLEARWEDWRDDVPGALEFVKEPREVAVGHWTFERGVPMPAQRQEFGDTRHRRVYYRLRAASRFREYLPVGKELPGGADLDLTRTGPEQPVEVPASAPPDPPRIAYAVPAFGWRHDAGPGSDVALGPGETLRRTRLGGGLRVFLRRPWFSSGEGERLAVILQGPDTVPMALLSRIGIDPTVGEAAQPEDAELEPSMFTGAVTEGSVLLSEREARVAIASFEPRFDKGRQLWACDVTADMAALSWGDWPFVRLALARHQPEAVDGAHLSKVELAQWAQLAPDRSLTVTRTAPDRATVELRGRGRTSPEPNRLLVAIERAVGASPDELDWRPAAGGPAPELDVDLWLAGIVPQPDGDELLWGPVEVPVPFAGAGESLRLTVRELERRPGEGEVGRGAFRITYADTARL
jgi:hypothetical protein